MYELSVLTDPIIIFNVYLIYKMFKMKNVYWCIYYIEMVWFHLNAIEIICFIVKTNFKQHESTIMLEFILELDIALKWYAATRWFESKHVAISFSYNFSTFLLIKFKQHVNSGPYTTPPLDGRLHYTKFSLY